MEVHDNSSGNDWLFTEMMRLKLYFHLFIPTTLDTAQGYPTGDHSIFRDIICGKIEIVKALESFMVEAATTSDASISGLDACTRLNSFVEDAVLLIRILKSPADFDRRSDADSLLASNHPFRMFDARFSSWKKRWKGPWSSASESRLQHFWDDYKDGLCDAIFGLWPAPNNYRAFHREKRGDEDADGCAATLLRSISLGVRPATHVPKGMRTKLLDAGSIESNGPFRFVTTDLLHQHLMIRAHKIFVYTNWKKWAGIRHHAVLRNEYKDITTFDILTSQERHSHNVAGNIREDLCRLHRSIQLTIFLLFFQSSGTKETPHPPRRAWYGRHKETSLDIARRLGIMETEDEVRERINVILEKIGTSWESLLEPDVGFRQDDPFKYRLDDVYSTLQEWKPTNFLEMRHPGYGSVDAVALYGFYFALMVGVIAIIGFALTAAQTYAAYKAIG